MFSFGKEEKNKIIILKRENEKKKKENEVLKKKVLQLEKEKVSETRKVYDCLYKLKKIKNPPKKKPKTGLTEEDIKSINKSINILNKQKGAGKFKKESKKKHGSYNYLYVKQDDNIEEQMNILKSKLKKEYLKIDFTDDMAGVKLESVYEKIIGDKIEYLKKKKTNVKTKKEFDEIKMLLNTIKNRYPQQYEAHNIKIKNKIYSNYRKSKGYFNKLINYKI